MTTAGKTRATGERGERRQGPSWWTAVGLAVFGLLPGLARLLVALAGDPEATQSTDTAAQRLPLVVHGVTGTAFAVLGAFQFPTAFRRGRRTWHRRTGRLLIPLGLTAAASAIWLTLFYPHLHDSGALLSTFRLTFASALAASIVIAFAAIKRRDIARHRRWMIRAYALGLGAATQIFTLGFGQAIFGEGEISTALLTGAAWAINLAIAERVIRCRFERRPQSAAAVVVQQRQSPRTPTSAHWMAPPGDGHGAGRTSRRPPNRLAGTPRTCLSRPRAAVKPIGNACDLKWSARQLVKLL